MPPGQHPREAAAPGQHPPEAAAARPGAREPGAREPGARDPGPARPAGPARRDRDTAGRARNARPRDGLGRPLEHDADGEPPTPDAPALPPDAALDAAQRLLDAGRPFHAHEVLEASWKAAPPAERDLWQGLAQLAVGLTHARRGNAAGAATLLRRGAARISSYSPVGRYGVDPAGLAAAATRLAGRVESRGLAGLEPGALDLQLRG